MRQTTRRRRWGVCLLAAFTMGATPLAAQSPGTGSGAGLRAPFAWLDASLGPTMTGGGDYAFNGTLGAQAAATVRLPAGFEMEGAAFASGRGRWFGSCLTTGVVSARACAGFPAVTGWSLGLSLANSGMRQQLGAHVGLGAGSYRLRQPWTGDVAHATGYDLELGGATPVWAHFAVASQMRVIVIPHVFGRTHWLAPLTIGARLW